MPNIPSLWREFAAIVMRKQRPSTVIAASYPALRARSGPLRRILVTGNAGAGKTTVAIAMATALDLPYLGLDAIVWRPRWVRTPRLERRQTELQHAVGDSWVVDGVSDVFLEAADAIVFLDVPRRRCFARVARRNLPYLFRSRPGLPENCPEIQIVPTLAKIIWQFPKSMKPRILACARTRPHFFHIRTAKELDLATAALKALRVKE